MATSYPLIADHNLTENQTLELDIVIDQQKHSGFLLVENRKVHCYINSCPHTGATLNWVENQFLDVNQDFIQCSIHGALFEKSSGLCIRGPCLGAKLESLSVELTDGNWFLTDKRVSSVELQTGYSDNSVGI